MIEIETRVVPNKFDGSAGVLLQLPGGWVVLRPDDARTVAQLLTITAEEAENV